MDGLWSRRSAADDNAALSHECRLGDDNDGTLCRRFSRRKSEVLRLKVLGHHCKIQDYELWLRRNNAVDAVIEPSAVSSQRSAKRWSARRLIPHPSALIPPLRHVRLGTRASRGTETL